MKRELLFPQNGIGASLPKRACMRQSVLALSASSWLAVSPSSSSRSQLDLRYKALFNAELPVMAREQKWPICLNHCLLRCALDHHCGKCWYEVWERKSGALKSMSDAEVASVIAVGERMRDEGRDFVSEINQNSLEYRGKKVPSAMRK